jgi:hypothetical protein
VSLGKGGHDEASASYQLALARLSHSQRAAQLSSSAGAASARRQRVRLSSQHDPSASPASGQPWSPSQPGAHHCAGEPHDASSKRPGPQDGHAGASGGRRGAHHSGAATSAHHHGGSDGACAEASSTSSATGMASGGPLACELQDDASSPSDSGALKEAGGDRHEGKPLFVRHRRCRPLDGSFSFPAESWAL